jgi:hypothetical protein
MGRRYKTELSELRETYLRSTRFPIVSLVQAVADSNDKAVLAVGSGGSYAIAETLVTLHQQCARFSSKAVTPLEATAFSLDLSSTTVVLFSAGGRNPDILSAFKLLADAEPAVLHVVCGSASSPLARMARSAEQVGLSLLSTNKKDGFLATNSLLASITMLLRAYSECYPSLGSLPPALPEFSKRFSDSPIWEHEDIIVLYDAWTRPAAMDLESRFSEAALGRIHPADFRNFAHGRHYWLSKYGERTAILALSSSRYHRTARRTLALVPGMFKRLHVEYGGTLPSVILESLHFSVHAAQFASASRGTDPGRPKVATFGRKLYHLREFVAPPPFTTSASTRRKSSSCEVISSIYEQALVECMTELGRTRFQALVCDYDGTLVGKKERYSDIPPEIGAELSRLLKAGIRIGVATGRGKSVHKALRTAIAKQYWALVSIGYYNGSILRRLSDQPPTVTDEVDETLASLSIAIKSDPILACCASVESRHTQISVTPAPRVPLKSVWEYCHYLAHRYSPGAKVALSSHSVDIVAATVSKLALVNQLRGHSTANILCIGDRGRWPGNDAELLDEPHALSVLESSPALDRCWNLALAGMTGPQATLFYLRAIRTGSRSFTLRAQRFARETR